jgi:predicted small lipoprotein YifL
MIVTVMSVYKVFSLVLLAMLMQACGQTGPLYMPDDSKPPVYVPKQTPIEEDK